MVLSIQYNIPRESEVSKQKFILIFILMKLFWSVSVLHRIPAPGKISLRLYAYSPEIDVVEALQVTCIKKIKFILVLFIDQQNLVS